MRVVSAEGTTYVLLDATDKQCRVRRLDTGAMNTLRPAALSEATVVDAPDQIAAAVAPKQADRAHALLAELTVRGPTAVRTLLDQSGLCESDLHGLVAELQYASLLEKTTIAGERGYRVTRTAEEALEEHDSQSNS